MSCISNMADEDEEDYMSDKFLLGLDNSRPGLPVVNRVAKQYKKEEKHKLTCQRNKTKPMHVNEAESREQGMANALDSSNKGFALLQKMGYKQGTGLGKEESGRVEPVPVELKTDRGGLGHAQNLKRQREIRDSLRSEAAKKRVKIEQRQREDFRKQMSSKFMERQISSDLYKSQKACEQLDRAKELPCPESWFWPEVKKNDDEQDGEKSEEEEEEQLQPSEKLIQLTEYLRSLHFYCIWCGTKYDDEEDLKSNCPGNTAEDHE